MEVTVMSKFDSLRIYFGPVLHLALNRPKILAVQSWLDGSSKYIIEYTMEGGRVLTEYDEKEKFMSILKQLEDFV